MKLKLALSALILAAGLAAPASAHVPGHGGWYGGGSSWDFLGARQVRHFTEQDRVFARGFRHYTQVKICVYNRPIRLYDLDVVFGNGGHQDLHVRHFLRPGECTRALDLRGRSRDIRFVNMVYQTAGRDFGPRAEVRVFAR